MSETVVSAMPAFNIITSGIETLTDDIVLSSVFEIENILIHISDLDSKLEHLKGLKKYRIETADIEIKSLESQISQFRDLIRRTMFVFKPNEKSLQFPSVGKVVKRKGSTSYVIKDETAFLDYMEQEGRYDEVIRTKAVVDVRAAKKVIDELTDSGKSIPGVEMVKTDPSISITFEKDPPKLSKTTIKEVSNVKLKSASTMKQDLDDLDNLDV